MGSVRYPQAQILMQFSRLRSRNIALGKFANELGLTDHSSADAGIGTKANTAKE